MSLPGVSVLIPVHNGASYLLEAVESVWAQNSIELEVVVVDDASDDDTTSILDDIDDPRLRRVCLKQRVGLSGALNAGLNVCRAPLVARLDADDRCLPGRIDRQVAIMEQRPKLAALGTSALLVDRDGRPRGRRNTLTGSGAVLRRLRWRNAVIHPSVMFRRDVVRELGGYSLTAGHFEDYELWLRLAAVAGLDNLGEPLIAYRIHPGQITSAKISDQAALRAVGDVRQALARSRGESLTLARWRHRVWVEAQLLGDRRRR